MPSEIAFGPVHSGDWRLETGGGGDFALLRIVSIMFNLEEITMKSDVCACDIKGARARAPGAWPPLPAIFASFASSRQQAAHLAFNSE